MKTIPFDRSRILIAYLVFCVVIILPALFFNVMKIDLAVAIFGILLVFLTLVSPHWGIVATISSLAIVEVLPDIPLASSFTALLGGVTLVSYLFHAFIQRGLPLPDRLENGFWLGSVLIVWILVSNPAAALLLGDRVWIWTLVQLWLVAWLARNLINNPATTKLLMIWVLVANLFSVFVVFQQGVVGETAYQSQRGYGLSIGSNTTARYLTIALLFTYYLYMINPGKKFIYQLIYAIGAIILALGVVYTASRTGLILILVAVGLILISPSAKGKSKKWSFLFLGLAAFLLLAPNNLFKLLETIVPSIVSGSDTAGLRYALWQAGKKMFQDSPFRGVGIGQFQYQLPYYGTGIVQVGFLTLTPHSMYVQLLSETGIIGLILFIGMGTVALNNLFKRMTTQDYNQAMIGWVWFATLMVIFVGGITKTDFSEKLLWVALGIGFFDITKVKEDSLS